MARSVMRATADQGSTPVLGPGMNSKGDDSEKLRTDKLDVGTSLGTLLKCVPRLIYPCETSQSRLPKEFIPGPSTGVDP